MFNFIRQLLAPATRRQPADLLAQFEAFVQELMARKELDDHRKELIMRAHIYTLRRMEDGAITDFWTAKMVFAAFGDGFCTGIHKGVPH